MEIYIIITLCISNIVFYLLYKTARSDMGIAQKMKEKVEKAYFEIYDKNENQSCLIGRLKNENEQLTNKLSKYRKSKRL